MAFAIWWWGRRLCWSGRKATKPTNLPVRVKTPSIQSPCMLLAFDDDNEEGHVPFFAISPLREPRCLIALRHFAHHVDASSHFAASHTMLTHHRTSPLHAPCAPCWRIIGLSHRWLCRCHVLFCHGSGAANCLLLLLVVQHYVFRPSIRV